ncbi:uncharacterized protein [Vicugna pacos]|uniref:Uncharacterized protein isoform X2 n=1 Tax=Vicugna pacos TaxID=30538 RepID=A0ABM5EGY7_VICPA
MSSHNIQDAPSAGRRPLKSVALRDWRGPARGQAHPFPRLDIHSSSRRTDLALCQPEQQIKKKTHIFHVHIPTGQIVTSISRGTCRLSCKCPRECDVKLNVSHRMNGMLQKRVVVGAMGEQLTTLGLGDEVLKEETEGYQKREDLERPFPASVMMGPLYVRGLAPSLFTVPRPQSWVCTPEKLCP